MHYGSANPKGDGGTEFTCVGFERGGGGGKGVVQHTAVILSLF